MNKIADKIVFSLLSKIKHGKINLKNFDGKQFIIGDKSSDLEADLIVKKPGFFLEIINKGSIGLAESYMRNEIETNNLTNLIEILAKNIKTVHKFSGAFDLPILNYVKNFFIKNTKERSKENISKHYDLGNEFFSTWLDKTLTYSSAIFENGKNNLEDAQINKYKKLSNLIKPKAGDKMLEIGCGWGGYAEYVGKNYDVKIDCITISKKQFDYAKERIFKKGLNEKVNIKMMDYRDVKSKYNSIASIEMIEAVGQKYLKNYFKTIKENLKSGGTAAIQAITIDDNLYNRYKSKQDFIQKYIFPGGFLPCKKNIIELANENNLNFNQCYSYGKHYSDTLMVWRDEFQKKWNEISKQGFDITFKRMWNFYLSYCEAGFKSKNIDLIQFSLQNK